MNLSRSIDSGIGGRGEGKIDLYTVLIYEILK